MKELDSYLNDHLAGSVGALELIARWKHLYEGKPLSAFFTGIEAEIRADQDTLRDLMRSLGIEESNVRQAGAWVAEKIGRARFMIAGDEPDGLGLVLALEGLIMGIMGKKLMWGTLAAANLPKVEAIDLRKLQRRAEQQIERAEAERIRAARRALESPTG